MNDPRFEELLPWYVNGTLGPDDRAFVERHLAEHPQARAELDWFGSLQLRLRESAPEVPATIGLARMLERIRAERPTLSQRVGAFVGSFGLRPAFVLAGIALLALQSGTILNLLYGAREDASEIRALRATTVTEGPLLKINFAPDAKEADIRLLLVSVHGQLAGGPGQLGDYYVRVPAGEEQASLARLSSDRAVQAVTLAPGLPPRE